MSRKEKVILFVPLGLVLLLLGSMVATNAHYHRKIRRPQRIDIYYYLGTRGGPKVKLVSISDPAEIEALSKSVFASGVWMPSRFSVPTVELRLDNGEGGVEQILIWGGYGIRAGGWTAFISKGAIEHISGLADKYGDGMPTTREYRRMQNPRYGE